MALLLKNMSMRRSPIPVLRNDILTNSTHSQVNDFKNEPYEEDAVQVLAIDCREARSLLPKPGLQEFAFRLMFFKNWSTLVLTIWSSLIMLRMKDHNDAGIISYERYPIVYIFFCWGIIFGGLLSALLASNVKLT